MAEWQVGGDRGARVGGGLELRWGGARVRVKLGQGWSRSGLGLR